MRTGRRLAAVAVGAAALLAIVAPAGRAAADDPTADDPTADDPTADDPTAGDPTAADPTAGDPTAGELAQQLAERFAPVMMLKQQEHECDEQGEPYRPSTVDIVLGNPEIALRQAGGGDPVVKRGPTAADLYRLGEGFFLDFPGSSLEPKCIYERDFRKYAGDRPAAVYAHVVQDPSEPDAVYVQYWFYWYYNDWNNKHESDWEGIAVKFAASTVAEALASEPVAVGYSQHEGGERARWDDAKLERDGDHPVVYSSARSHASYFGSALYLGRSGGEGFGCDDTSGPSDRVRPEVILLPDGVDDPDDPLAWLAYAGRWGERQSGSFNGPTGIAVKARWLNPSPWFDGLRDSSVVIPTGDSQASTVIDAFCSVVERGSMALIDFTVSPARMLLTLAIVVFVVWFVVRRTAWDPTPVAPLVRRRRAGQIVRTALRAYGRDPAAYLMFGLVYVPAAIAAGLLVAVVRFIPFVGALLSLAGKGSGTGLFVSLIVGGVANFAAFVLVSAMVADHLQRGERGVAAGVAAMRAAWARRGDLAEAFVRSFVIVAALTMTVIGAPWGLRQLLRYQFVPQVIVAEGCEGRPALRRSSSLVRGRWFHTALVSAGLNGFVGLAELLVGLLLLVLVSGIPLWLLSAVMALLPAVMVPVAAISMALLYGDAVAESAEADAESEAESAGVAPAVSGGSGEPGTAATLTPA